MMLKFKFSSILSSIVGFSSNVSPQTAHLVAFSSNCLPQTAHLIGSFQMFYHKYVNNFFSNVSLQIVHLIDFYNTFAN